MSLRKNTGIGICAVIAIVAAYIGISSYFTRAAINDFEESVLESAKSRKRNILTPQAISELPDPVQSYFAFVFPDGVEVMERWVQFEQSGDFRRPLKDNFAPTTARL